MITLHPFQFDLIEKTRERMRAGVKKICIQSSCGSGKTVIAGHILKAAAEKGTDAWFICHRKEIASQASDTFNSIGVRHGLVASGATLDVMARTQICSVQSLRHRAKFLRRPGLILWDETTHLPASTWAAIYNEHKDAHHVGFTATPKRSDSKGLAEFYQEMICGPSMGDLISGGYLSPYRVFSPPCADLSGVHTSRGDYVRSELASVMDKPKITGDVLSHYFKHLTGKKALVFCVSIEHSQRVAAEFRAAGVASQHIDGETPDEERRDGIRKLEAGEIRIVTSVDIFSEGLSVNNLDAVICVRPTQSVGLFVQFVGRAIRTAPGKKEAIILDHAGLFQRFGFPEHLAWSLSLNSTRNARKVRDVSSPGVAICPACFAAQYSGADRCSYCGHALPIKKREVEEVDGELVELQRKAAVRERKIQQGGARTLEELIELGRARGYKNPYGWAAHLHKARMNRGKK